MKERQTTGDIFQGIGMSSYWIVDKDHGGSRPVVRGCAGTEDLKKELYRGHEQRFCSGELLLETVAWITRLSATIPDLLRDGGVMTPRGEILPVTFGEISPAADRMQLFIRRRCVVRVYGREMFELGFDPLNFHLTSRHSVYIFQRGAADQLRYEITRGKRIEFYFQDKNLEDRYYFGYVSGMSGMSALSAHTAFVRNQIRATRGMSRDVRPMLVGQEKVLGAVLVDVVRSRERNRQ